jgi:Carboxypeptidase regulatory-like domain/Putative Ig domain
VSLEGNVTPRHRRLTAALSSAVLAVSGIATVFLTAGPAGATTGPARPAALAVPAASVSAPPPPTTTSAPSPSASQGTIEGVVSSGAGGDLVGIAVTVCNAGSGSCSSAATNTSGFYEVTGLAAGTYDVAAADAPLLPGHNGPIVLPAGGVQIANLVLLVNTPLPPGVGIPGSSGSPPLVHWNQFTPFTVGGRCTNGIATFTIVQNGAVIASGPMPETPRGSGTYGGVIPPFAPNHHGYAQVIVTVSCPGGGTQTVTFCIYIDPSGTVIGPDGLPVGGATVTLLSAPTAAGPYTPVPNGSSVMSPANRTNPAVTTTDGRFGWDVVPGYYEVEAQKTGCVAPTTPPSAIAVTPVLTIPPAATGLLLTLDCTGSPATSITSAGSAAFTAGTGGSFTLTAAGTPAPTWAESGTLPAGVSFVPQTDGTAALVVSAAAAAGVTSFTATAGNGVGSSVAQTFTLNVNPVGGPTITSAASAGFTAGTGGTFTVTSAGGSTPMLSESGSLPTGVSFMPGGNGTGTLVVGASAAAGSTPITFTATGSSATATQSFALTVTAPAPAITSAASADFALGSGVGGTFTVASTGVPTPTLTETGALPSGVTFTPNSGGTATLAVAPGTASGTITFTVTAANGAGPAATQTFTLTIT